MPKMSKEIAKKASKAESKGGGSRKPLPEGEYLVRLVEVEAKESSNGNPMWVWKYEVVEPSEHAGRYLWNNTTLVDAAMWAVKQTFDAFGVETDTDTDDLIGEEVTVEVSQSPITQGPSSGKMRNNVERVFPASEFEEVESDEPKKGKKDKKGKKGKKDDGEDSPW